MKDVQRQVDAQLRRVDTHKPPGHASDRVSSNPRRPPMSWLGFLTQPFRNSQSHDERFGDEHRKRKGKGQFINNILSGQIVQSRKCSHSQKYVGVPLKERN